MSMITDSFNLIANLYPRMTPGLFARLFAPDDKKMFNMWLKHENISMFLKELAGDEIIPLFRSIPIKEEPIKIMKTQQPSPGVRSMEQISKILGWKG